MGKIFNGSEWIDEAEENKRSDVHHLENIFDGSNWIPAPKEYSVSEINAMKLPELTALCNDLKIFFDEKLKASDLKSLIIAELGLGE